MLVDANILLYAFDETCRQHAAASDWFEARVAWIPQSGPGHRAIPRRLVCDLDLRGHLVSDAVLSALSVEHGLAVVSADSDFAWFRELTWVNPVAGEFGPRVPGTTGPSALPRGTHRP
jgi:predicted nucleic acid-binding protein